MNATVKENKVTIPKELTGTVYAILAQANASLVSDDTTTAGPAVFQFQKTIGTLKAANSSSNGSASTAQSDNTKNSAVGPAFLSILVLAPITGLVMILMA